MDKNKIGYKDCEHHRDVFERRLTVMEISNATINERLNNIYQKVNGIETKQNWTMGIVIAAILGEIVMRLFS